MENMNLTQSGYLGFTDNNQRKKEKKNTLALC